MHGNVGKVDARERDFVDEDGSNGIEEDLECAEEGFSEYGVEEYGFEGCGKICV